MAPLPLFDICLLIFLILLPHLCTSQPNCFALNRTMPFIIHTDTSKRPSNFTAQHEWFLSIMGSLRSHKEINGCRLFHEYEVAIQGFATRITLEEAEIISKIPGVIGVHRDVGSRFQTTRSPGFLGLNVSDGVWSHTKFGEDVIIGVVDTGIWPESKSFRDDGLGPVGSKWKGTCESSTDFPSTLCNNKLVGARFIKPPNWCTPAAHNSPRDEVGHGTHAAAIAAGSPVQDSSFLGFGRGTAVGMAPKAKIAMYKITFCFAGDIISAIELAIKDGVDVLSLSISSPPGQPEIDKYLDPVTQAAFEADRRGIFVACGAGNEGPYEFTVKNSAPWVTTVGAGSLDRRFPGHIVLGNGKRYEGETFYDKTTTTNHSGAGQNFMPLLHLSNCTEPPRHVVAGKILACSDVRVTVEGPSIQRAGVAGLIGVNSKFGEATTARPYAMPFLEVGRREADEILEYIRANPNPVARFELKPVTDVGASVRAPIIPYFTSRGPSNVVPEILKPDLIAPGVNILSAWRGDVMAYNMESGTSMACPHVAGVAALIREAHPHWSPARIRSALMTTSVSIDNTGRGIADHMLEPATPLDMGAGHIRPAGALDPGLAYDAGTQDYINLMCTMDFGEDTIKMFVKGPFNCTRFEGGPGQLNYPSMVAVFNGERRSATLKRTVTKVSSTPAAEAYRARIVNPSPQKVRISVEPETITLEALEEKADFMLHMHDLISSSADPSQTSSSSSGKYKDRVFARLAWESPDHVVTSPISVLWEKDV